MQTKDTPASLPVIGITMGCPVGIGPEIILRLFSGREGRSDYQPVILGDMAVLQSVCQKQAIDVVLKPWAPELDRENRDPGILPVLNLSDLDPAGLVWGQPDMQTGKAMAGYIEEAVSLIQKRKIDAMVTCPIAKSSLNLAGYEYPGHTEMLASLCQTKDFAMMMSGDRLRVSLVTIHSPLSRIPFMITTEEVYRLIRLTHSALCQDFGIDEPRIGVAGLNPHAGEAGLFGDEERSEIAPAIKRAKEHGWQVTGPYPPDTVFFRAAKGEFDAVVSMYHDQGLIPFKLLHFVDGVNITLGLPIVRTSVDHGTAYDIAGKGVAQPASLKEACRTAAMIFENRKIYSLKRKGQE
jgi:4-hydroxythreonine-4-phosphate dehydrogenase